jgi:signal peptidase I
MEPPARRRLTTAVLLFAGLTLLPSYVWAYKLTGASESPTITMGGTFLVNKAAFDVRLPYSQAVILRVASPQRGDVVQFRHPTLPIMGPKRVIGLPGEIIEFRDNRVLIDGRMLPLRQLNRALFAWVAPRNHMGLDVFDEDGHSIAFTPGAGRYRDHSPVRLGPRQYYLVGDNRDNSLDSREWGPFDERQILGKVIYIVKR